MPTDQEINAATFWIVSEVYHRPDVVARLADCLADFGRLPLMATIAGELGVPLSDFCTAFAAEILRRTGIAIGPIGVVPVATVTTEKDTVH